MGVIKKGSLLDGVTGRVGDFVLRQQGDRTIVSHRPRGKKSSRPTTEARQKTLTRFQQAVAFAREARRRHAYRSLSRLLGGHSPYHVALQDFLSEPQIEEVDDAAVSLRGGSLLVRVSEAVAVRSVRVKMPAIEEISQPRTSAEEPAALLAPNPAARKQPKARLPIPAALFFRRAEPEAEPAEAGGPVAENSQDAAADAGHSEVEALPAAGRFGAYAQREARPGAEHVETWRVMVPRAGEVEIIASDYAGNQSVHRTWVGPKF